MFKVIGFILALLVAGVIAFAAARPDTFQVQRATRIQAPPEKVYAHVSDFTKWPAWSPYEKRDPAMKRSLGPVTQGPGAVYAWQGNGEVGEGRMEITTAAPPEKVVIALDFVRPMETRNVVEFTIRPAGDATEVSWTMRGPSPFAAKVMGIFFDMDQMIGADFEKGLASLKSLAEQQG